MSKIYDGIMGVVVGDALGVPVEFKPRTYLDQNPVTDMIGYGTYNQPPGTWSDDSSMTLATLESIGLLQMVDPTDIRINFSRWSREDVPAEKCGGISETDNGNGALMRILPVAMQDIDFIDKLVDVNRVAGLTHAHQRSNIACFIYAGIVTELLKGKSKHVAVRAGIDVVRGLYEDDPEWVYYNYLHVVYLREGDDIKSSEYVVDTLEAAIWCFLGTESYKDCVLTAVNLGDDTDTTAAVAGGLAGIYYGAEAIPAGWVSQIPRLGWIKELCERVNL